jgi:thiamine pyrophosphate-dependent acetolactate synthase large subunit-like protein
MKLHQALARALADHGVTTLFGLIGDANLFMVDSYIRDCGGRYISAAHEAGAVLMALGYASGTGDFGVATVTHGPATTNALTPLVEGVKGRLPLLLICGDTAIGDRENLQDAPQRELIVATGAGFEQVRTPATALDDLAIAIRRAHSERRPIALNVPIDFQLQEVDYRAVPVRFPDRAGLAGHGSDMDEAVGMIAASRRPVILGGRGAAGARAALVRLAERIGAPLATTLKGRDLFRGEAFNLGVFGTLSTPVATDAIIASDLVLAFGASLNHYTASKGAFLRGKRVIQCDADPAVIGRGWPVNAGLIGDCAAVAETLCSLMDMAEIPPPGVRDDELQRALGAYRPGFEDHSGAATIDICKVLTRLEAAFPAERVVVTDAGRFVMESWRRISGPDPLSFHLTVNFGSIGLGTAWAVGAACAAPGRPVLLLCGDGGFMHGGLAEFNTAVRHGIDLVAVVFNDGGYGAEEIQFRARQMDPSLALFDWPELAPLAETLGGEGLTVRNDDDLGRAIEAIAGRTRPLLIDVKLDPSWMPAVAH